MTALDTVTIDTFAPLVNTTFRVQHDDGVTEMRLTQVTSFLDGKRRRHAKAKRDPFNLIFLGPADRVLPQRTYRFTHDVVGELDIFIVPVGRDEEGTEYEAVFT
ncbi:MAG: DUF6916 family protein [Thermoanaerobaculia bacterium]